MLEIFKKQAELNGTVEIIGLPPFKGYSISLSLFPVNCEMEPIPFSGEPPPESKQDEEKVSEANHFDREDSSTAINSSFHLRRPCGWYYIQVNVILYRENAGKMFAQVERFFFRKRPLQIPQDDGQQVTLPVNWPSTGIEDLEHYGSFTPKDIDI